MKTAGIILFIFLTLNIYGQSYRKITTNNETYYLLTEIVSSNFKPNLPDGRWKIMNSGDSMQNEYAFHLKNNKVNGPFFYCNKYGTYCYGNYYQDSLWTFLFNPEDTTFKTGYWIKIVYGRFPELNHTYRIPGYDSSGLYTENWLYFNGQRCFQRTYKKGFGLTEEIQWFSKTNQMESHLIMTPNYSVCIKYTENDKIESVTIKQGLVYSNLIVPDLIVESNISVFDSSGAPITVVSLDSNNKVSGFRDNSNKLDLQYHNNGTIDLNYKNKKGRWKNKRVRIKYK